MKQSKYSFGEDTVERNDNEYYYPTSSLTTFTVKTGILAHLLREYNDVAEERFNSKKGVLSKEDAKECWNEATKRIIEEDNDEEYNDRVLKYSRMVAKENNWKFDGMK